MDRWAAELLRGHPDAAWDSFLDLYRRLVFATIRHFVSDPDDVMDVFARVLEALREDDFRRLRTYLREPDHCARFTTWLVTVVRHQTIDWLRARDGRERVPVAVQSLPPLERRIVELVFLKRHSHVEAYEMVRARDEPALSYRAYLVALRKVYQAVGAGYLRTPEAELAQSLVAEEPAVLDDEEVASRSRLVQQVLADLPPDDRVVLQLYVMEGMAADAVARVAGLPNAKAVYNRVYRLMDLLRPRLRDAGLEAEPDG